MTTIALCASFPSGARGREVEPYYSTDIALAVVAIAEATLRSRATLVFGAHPTVSPIVLHTARLLDAGPLVTIYQSAYFEEQTTEAVRILSEELGAKLRTTPIVGDRTASLTAMREAMFSLPPPDAAFFCGGMSGLDEEFQLAQASGARPYLVAEPGGRTAQLVQRASGSASILAGRAYSSLALAALEAVGAGTPQATGPYEEEMYRADAAEEGD
jgi:hypothetical protein